MGLFQVWERRERIVDTACIREVDGERNIPGGYESTNEIIRALSFINRRRKATFFLDASPNFPS